MDILPTPSFRLYDAAGDLINITYARRWDPNGRGVNSYSVAIASLLMSFTTSKAAEGLLIINARWSDSNAARSPDESPYKDLEDDPLARDTLIIMHGIKQTGKVTRYILPYVIDSTNKLIWQIPNENMSIATFSESNVDETDTVAECFVKILNDPQFEKAYLNPNAAYEIALQGSFVSKPDTY